MQQLLQQHPAAGIRVFAVWEPVLFMDWQRPTTAALGRLSDSRVTQYWDHDHVFAKQIANDASQGQPNCCKAHNVLFDLISVYPVGAKWSDRLPPANVFDGPIFRTVPNIQPLLSGH